MFCLWLSQPEDIPDAASRQVYKRGRRRRKGGVWLDVEDTRQLHQRDNSEKFVPIILVDESDRKIEIEMAGPSICCLSVLPTLWIGGLCFKCSSKVTPGSEEFVVQECTGTAEIFDR